MIGFLLPLFVMIVCYLQLIRHLRRREEPLPPEQTKRTLKKVTIMVFIVTVVFLVCWAPYYSYEISLAYYYTLSSPKTHSMTYLCYALLEVLTQALVYFSSCANPFIYAISSRNFSKSLTFSVQSKKCVLGQRSPSLFHFSLTYIN